MDETFINRAFLSISKPVSVKVIRRKDMFCQPAGYCFIEFATESEAERVLKLVNATDIPGSNPTKRFRLNRSMAGKMWDVGPSHSIFVGDLDASVTDDRLEDFFSKRYRSVKGAKLMWDESGFSRGYGFVRFSDEVEMKRALIEMQGAQGLGSKPIRVSIATPKSKTDTSSSSLTATNTTSATAMDTYTQWLSSYDPYTYYQQYYNYYGCYPQQTQQQYSNYYQQTTAATTTQQYYTTQQSTTEQQAYISSSTSTATPITTAAVTADAVAAAYTVAAQQQVSAATQQSRPQLEDPNEPVDVEQENNKYFSQHTGILDEILGSHWQPLDTITSKILTETTPVL